MLFLSGHDWYAVRYPNNNRRFRLSYTRGSTSFQGIREISKRKEAPEILLEIDLENIRQILAVSKMDPLHTPFSFRCSMTL